MMDVTRNQNLTPFLADDAGVDSGLMIAHYTQAAMVSEAKRNASPCLGGLDPVLGDAGRPRVHGLVGRPQAAQGRRQSRQRRRHRVLRRLPGLRYARGSTCSGHRCRDLRDPRNRARPRPGPLPVPGAGRDDLQGQGRLPGRRRRVGLHRCSTPSPKLPEPGCPKADHRRSTTPSSPPWATSTLPPQPPVRMRQRLTRMQPTPTVRARRTEMSDVVSLLSQIEDTGRDTRGPGLPAVRVLEHRTRTTVTGSSPRRPVVASTPRLMTTASPGRGRLRPVTMPSSPAPTWTPSRRRSLRWPPRCRLGAGGLRRTQVLRCPRTRPASTGARRLP